MPNIDYADYLERIGGDGLIGFQMRLQCLYLEDGECLKLYSPDTLRQIGRPASCRRLAGYVGYVLTTDIDLNAKRRWKPRPPSLTLCPVDNFVPLIRHSALSAEGEPQSIYFPLLRQILRIIPNNVAELQEKVGSFSSDELNTDQTVALINYIRAELAH